ncbi:hypothetical protein Tco_0238221 [Tanacetum coccineum]
MFLLRKRILGSIFSSIFIAINSSNSTKSSSSRGVPLIEIGLFKIRGTLMSFSISRITKSTKKVNLPTSTSMFSVIPTEYCNDRSGNCTLILVGLTVSRDSFGDREYGIRLMLTLRSAKALEEKVLLKNIDKRRWGYGILGLYGFGNDVSLIGFGVYGVGSSSPLLNSMGVHQLFRLGGGSYAFPLLVEIALLARFELAVVDRVWMSFL